MGGHRNIGTPQLRKSDVIRKDTKEKGEKIEDAQDRRTWILKTRCADRNWENVEEENMHHRCAFNTHDDTQF